MEGLFCNKIEDIDLKNKNNFKINKACLANSEKVKTGYGNSHNKSLQKVIDYKLKKTNSKPLKAIETLPSLKLLNMMYMSFEKKKWINFTRKKIISRLGN